MNLRQAEYYLEVIHCGGITAASRKLMISQPALSQVIRNLEDELGFSLFIRGTTPLRLTNQGKKIADIAHRIILFHQEIDEEISSICAVSSRSFHFGVLPGQAAILISKVLPAYINTHPNVDVSINEYGSLTIEQMLVSGKLDLGIIDCSKLSSRLKGISLKKDMWVLLANRNSQFGRTHANESTISLSDMIGQKFIAKPAGCRSRQILDQLSQNDNIPLDIAYEFSNFTDTIALFPEMNCLALLPYSIYRRYAILQESANIYYLDQAEMNYYEYLCYSKGKPLPDYITDFIHVVCAYYQTLNFDSTF